MISRSYNQIRRWDPTASGEACYRADFFVIAVHRAFDTLTLIKAPRNSEIVPLPLHVRSVTSRNNHNHYRTAYAYDVGQFQLMDMGFAEIRAKKGLMFGSAADLDSAVNWLMDHQEDADIDEPIPDVPDPSSAMDVEGAGGTSPLSPIPYLLPGSLIFLFEGNHDVVLCPLSGLDDVLGIITLCLQQIWRNVQFRC